MFSFDPEEKKKKEAEKKDKERQKKIDKMLEEYEKYSNKREEDTTETSYNKDNGNTEKKAEKGNLLTKPWSKNKYANLFLKIVGAPFACIVGFGCACWGAGFAVNELSKVASFLSDISLPEKITNLIATSSFWKFSGVVVAICATIFIVASVITAVQNGLATSKNYKEKQISKYRSYNISKQKIHSCGYIKNNKELYNAKLQNNDKSNEYNVYDNIKKHFNKDDKYTTIYNRNKQYLFGKNYKNFHKNNKFLNTSTNKNKDIIMEFQSNRINIKI